MLVRSFLTLALLTLTSAIDLGPRQWGPFIPPVPSEQPSSTTTSTSKLMPSPSTSSVSSKTTPSTTVAPSSTSSSTSSSIPSTKTSTSASFTKPTTSINLTSTSSYETDWSSSSSTTSSKWSEHETTTSKTTSKNAWENVPVPGPTNIPSTTREPTGSFTGTDVTSLPTGKPPTVSLPTGSNSLTSSLTSGSSSPTVTLPTGSNLPTGTLPTGSGSTTDGSSTGGNLPTGNVPTDGGSSTTTRQASMTTIISDVNGTPTTIITSGFPPTGSLPSGSGGPTDGSIPGNLPTSLTTRIPTTGGSSIFTTITTSENGTPTTIVTPIPSATSLTTIISDISGTPTTIITPIPSSGSGSSSSASLTTVISDINGTPTTIITPIPSSTRFTSITTNVSGTPTTIVTPITSVPSSTQLTTIVTDVSGTPTTIVTPITPVPSSTSLTSIITDISGTPTTIVTPVPSSTQLTTITTDISGTPTTIVTPVPSSTRLTTITTDVSGTPTTIITPVPSSTFFTSITTDISGTPTTIVTPITSVPSSTQLTTITTDISGTPTTIVTLVPSATSLTSITTNISGTPTTIITPVPSSTSSLTTILTTVDGTPTTITTPVVSSGSSSGTSLTSFTTNISGTPTTIVTPVPSATSLTSITTDISGTPTTIITPILTSSSSTAVIAPPLSTTITTDVNGTPTTITTLVPTASSTTTIFTTSISGTPTTITTVLPTGLPPGVTSVLTFPPPGMSTEHVTSSQWSSNTWITTSHDGQNTLVPVLVGCPACGGSGGGIIIWGFPPLPRVSFQFPAFPDLPSFHLPCVRIFGVAIGDCTSNPEYDNEGNPGPPGTNPTSVPTSNPTTEVSSTDTSSTSSTSTSTTEVDDCPTELPTLPFDGPLSTSLPNLGLGDSDEVEGEVERHQKRAIGIAGRVVHTVTIYKRGAAETISTINGCSLTTLALSAVTIPAYPGGSKFWASDRAGNLLPKYSPISRFYVASTPVRCVPIITQVPANQIPVPRRSTNDDMSMDHVYEIGWLSAFMDSVISVNGGTGQLSCVEANAIFFDHGSCPRNYMKEIWEALPSEINLDFVAMSQYLNGDAKGWILGSQFRTPAALLSSNVVSPANTWPSAQRIISDKLSYLGVLSVACLMVKEPIMLSLIQKTNNRIYYYMLEVDARLSRDTSLPQRNFDLAGKYQAFMNSYATRWNSMPGYLLQLITDIGTDITQAGSIPGLTTGQRQALNGLRNRLTRFSAAYNSANNPAYFNINFNWLASPREAGLESSGLVARQAGSCTISAPSSSVSSTSATSSSSSSSPTTSSSSSTVSADLTKPTLSCGSRLYPDWGGVTPTTVPRAQTDDILEHVIDFCASGGTLGLFVGPGSFLSREYPLDGANGEIKIMVGWNIRPECAKGPAIDITTPRPNSGAPEGLCRLWLDYLTNTCDAQVGQDKRGGVFETNCVQYAWQAYLFNDQRGKLRQMADAFSARLDKIRHNGTFYG